MNYRLLTQVESRFSRALLRKFRGLCGCLLVAMGLAGMTSVAHAAPSIDGQFGALGMVRIGVPWRGLDDYAVGAAVQADNKTVVLGFRRWHSGFEEPIVLRFNADGSLDQDFGQQGLAALDLKDPWDWDGPNGIGTPQSVMLLPKGSSSEAVLVIGDKGIARLTSNGVPDTTYGSSGYVRAHGIGRPVVQPDGGVLLVQLSDWDGPGMSILMGRIDRDGQWDRGFGDGGTKRIRGLPRFDCCQTPLLVARSDGGFVLAGSSVAVGGGFVLVGVGPGGDLDPAFGQGGLVSGESLGAFGFTPKALAFAEDERLWIFAEAEDNWHAVLIRALRSGAPDPEFAQSGRRQIDGCCGSHPAFGSMRLLPYQGGVAMVHEYSASTYASPPQLGFIYYFDAQGAPSFPGWRSEPLRAPGYRGLLVQHPQVRPDGQLVVPATAEVTRDCGSSSASCSLESSDIALLVFDPLGRLASTFGGGDGMVVWDSPALSDDRIDKILVQPDGKILAAGESTTVGDSVFAVRVQADGSSDATFGVDGRVEPASAKAIGGTFMARSSEGKIAILGLVEPDDPHAYVNARVEARRLDQQGLVEGGFVPALGGPTQVDSQVGLGFDSAGRILYAAGAVLEARLPDGSRDQAFGIGGQVGLPIEALQMRPREVSNAGLNVLSDGSVLVAVAGGGTVAVFKFNALGGLDQSFGASGIFSYQKPSYQGMSTYLFNKVTLFGVPGGDILVAAVYHVRNAPAPAVRCLYLLRVSPEGKLLSEFVLRSTPSDNWMDNWITLGLPDGGVFAAKDRKLYRVLPEGRLDLSLGEDGAFELPVSRVDALALDGSGKLLVGGSAATGAVLLRYTLDTSPFAVPVVEFFNSDLNHYFVTGAPGEVAAIEAGDAGPGWSRTGLAFKAFTTESGIAAGAQPVCRFYGTRGLGPNSHFYTVDPVECDLVRRDPGWTYEGTAFHVFPPANDQCAVGQQPVYRAYNQRFAQNDSNHRYTTDTAVYAQMQAQGWVGEGVAMCAAR